MSNPDDIKAMRSSDRRARLGALLGVLAVSMLALPNVALAGNSVTVERLEGADRYATSLRVAERYVEEAGGSVDAAVVVSGMSWTDAVLASGLAGRLGGPVVLSRSDGLAEDALGLLTRAGVSTIVVIGSPQAVSNEALAQMGGTFGSARRIDAGGVSAQSAAVAEAMGMPGVLPGRGRTVIVATSTTFADAMVAGGISARGRHPVLLVGAGPLDASVREYLDSSGAEFAVVMGGTAAVSQQIQHEIEALRIGTQRLSGTDRFDTARKAAESFDGAYSQTAGSRCFDSSVTALATAWVPYDAFSAGPLLGLLCAPLLLTDSTSVDAVTANLIAGSAHSLVVFGGQRAIPDSALHSLTAQAQASVRQQGCQLLRTLADDDEPQVRRGVGRNPNAPPDALRKLAADAEPVVRYYVAGNPNTPPDVLRTLADDDEPSFRTGQGVVRWAVAENPSTPVDVLRDLATDSDINVRGPVARNRSAPTDLLHVLASDVACGGPESVARNPSAAPATLRRLTSDDDVWRRSGLYDVRRHASANPNTPTDVLWQLTKAPLSRTRQPAVLHNVGANPSAPVELLRVLATHSYEGARFGVAQNPGTPVEVLRALAADTEPAVRSGVARNPSAPVELLRGLATDADSVVRLGVAINPDAPTELLRALAKDFAELPTRGELGSIFGAVRVQDGVAANPNAPADVLRSLATGRWYAQLKVLRNPNAPPDLLREFAANAEEDSYLRELAAMHPSLCG